MASLNFTITASAAEFTDFANRLGYMPVVFDVSGQSTPNPESRQDFLVRVMKESVAERFYTPFVTDIENEVRNQRDTDKENMRNVVRDRVSVTYTP